ncbi:MAG: hypothetical protein KDK70_39885 [Myxococcales bacterium]|nr:hypothetical protein [Myxococcales bacterium]
MVITSNSQDPTSITLTRTTEGWSWTNVSGGGASTPVRSEIKVCGVKADDSGDPVLVQIEVVDETRQFDTATAFQRRALEDYGTTFQITSKENTGFDVTVDTMSTVPGAASLAVLNPAANSFYIRSVADSKSFAMKKGDGVVVSSLNPGTASSQPFQWVTPRYPGGSEFGMMSLSDFTWAIARGGKVKMKSSFSLWTWDEAKGTISSGNSCWTVQGSSIVLTTYSGQPNSNQQWNLVPTVLGADATGGGVLGPSRGGS